jgi:predicted permease
MFRIFADNLLPVFLAAGAGYLLSARTKASPRSVAHVGYYLFAPCLIYRIIAGNGISGADFLRMAAFSMAVLGSLAGAAWLLARQLNLPRPLTAAVVLTVLLPNAGNFGLSANLFAFGDEGLAQASLYFVASSILTYTAGVFVASMGRSGVGRALAGLPRVPALWAVLAGFVMVETGASLPLPVSRALSLMADACIPVFIVVLGMQLHGARWKGRWLPLTLAAGLRLVGGPAVAILLSLAFGLDGAARQAAIFQSAMPSAVVTIILATEFEAEPDFVTTVVFLTTVVSPLTLTPLLAWLGA